jgi:2-polyprenyl-3-methyl-5-hydroxy-6-metoxy-1,4-benzoquinol methylase
VIVTEHANVIMGHLHTVSLNGSAQLWHERGQHCMQGKRVIELGCGCGLVGLCLAALGAHVLLTDLPEPLVGNPPALKVLL